MSLKTILFFVILFISCTHTYKLLKNRYHAEKETNSPNFAEVSRLAHATAPGKVSAYTQFKSLLKMKQNPIQCLPPLPPTFVLTCLNANLCGGNKEVDPNGTYPNNCCRCKPAQHCSCPVGQAWDATKESCCGPIVPNCTNTFACDGNFEVKPNAVYNASNPQQCCQCKTEQNASCPNQIYNPSSSTCCSTKTCANDLTITCSVNLVKNTSGIHPSCCKCKLESSSTCSVGLVYDPTNLYTCCSSPPPQTTCTGAVCGQNKLNTGAIPNCCQCDPNTNCGAYKYDSNSTNCCSTVLKTCKNSAYTCTDPLKPVFNENADYASGCCEARTCSNTTGTCAATHEWKTNLSTYPDCCRCKSDLNCGQNYTFDASKTTCCRALTCLGDVSSSTCTGNTVYNSNLAYSTGCCEAKTCANSSESCTSLYSNKEWRTD